MVVALILLGMVASALVAGWCYQHSQKEREELGEAVAQFKTAVGETSEAKAFVRFMYWLNGKLERSS